MVRTNTIVLNGLGAGVVRIKGTARALAMSVDGNGRYGYLDPRQGATLALAEAARNVACAGGLPIGGDELPQFRQSGAARDHVAVCGGGRRPRRGVPRLDIPITGGNVSLYNETDGRAILPTPVIGVVGLIDDASRVLTRVFRSAATTWCCSATTTASSAAASI